METKAHCEPDVFERWLAKADLDELITELERLIETRADQVADDWSTSDEDHVEVSAKLGMIRAELKSRVSRPVT